MARGQKTASKDPVVQDSETESPSSDPTVQEESDSKDPIVQNTIKKAKPANRPTKIVKQNVQKKVRGVYEEESEGKTEDPSTPESEDTPTL